MPSYVMFKDVVIPCLTGRSYSFKATVPLHVASPDIKEVVARGAMPEEEALAIMGQIRSAMQPQEEQPVVQEEEAVAEAVEEAAEEPVAEETAQPAQISRRGRG